MASLFTTDTLTQKREKQKTVYQETYDDCSFAFEFVPMDSSEKFCKQAFLEAYVEVDGFNKVDAVGYLDVSYSKIDQFNRLFYFISDDADPDVYPQSLENVSYGVLGTNGVNPFNNVKDEYFEFSNSLIKAGYANNASTYADNTRVRHDYVRYTAKAISGGYALSDIFSNESDLIEGVRDLDISFNMDFSKKINDLSGCVHEGESNEGWTSCKSLVTGLFDFSNEMDTTTTRFKRGTKFLRDLAEQSINTFESEKNMSKGEFWVKFHPGDAIAVRLTYKPENGNGNPAKNSLGFLGENKLNDRSYKIYLKFKNATLGEATYQIRKEFMNVVKYEGDADKAIGQKTVHMPVLLTDTLNTISLAKDAIAKSYENAEELIGQFPDVVFEDNVSAPQARNASGHVILADSKLKVGLGSINDIKTEIINASTSLINVRNFTEEENYQNVYSKINAVPGIMSNIADSVINIAEIVTAKKDLDNVSLVIPKTYEVMERTRKHAELNVSSIKPVLDSYVRNMSGMISLLNASSYNRLVNSSSLMNQDMIVITNKKRDAYTEFVYASVAQDATQCRLHSRYANDSATVTEKLNDEIIMEFNNITTEVANVSNMSSKLHGVSVDLTRLNSSVNAAPGFSGVNANTSTIVKNVLDGVIVSRNNLVSSITLKGFSDVAMVRKLDSKLKNMQSFYHSENAKKIADMWVTNEEVAASEAKKVREFTAAKDSVLTDAESFYNTAVTTRLTAFDFYGDSLQNLANASSHFTAAETQYDNASTTLFNETGLHANASQHLSLTNASYELANSEYNAADGDAAEKLADKLAADAAAATADNNYRIAQSNAEVLHSTATTLTSVATTEYELATAETARTEAGAAESEASRLSVINTGAKAAAVTAQAAHDAANDTKNNKKREEGYWAQQVEIAKREFDAAVGRLNNATVDKKEKGDQLEAARYSRTVANEIKNNAHADYNDKEQAKTDAYTALTDARDLRDEEDVIDENNADCRAYIAASTDERVVGHVDAPIAVAADKCIITIPVNEVTKRFEVNSVSKRFDINCELSDDFKALTINAHPTGVYYLRNVTDAENLGNNTNNLLDLDKQHIGGLTSTKTYKINEDGKTLNFNNRMPSTPGPKLLQVVFEHSEGSILGKAFALYLTQEQVTAGVVVPPVVPPVVPTGEVITLKSSKPFNESMATNQYSNNATILFLDGTNNEPSGITMQQIGNKVRFTFTEVVTGTLDDIRDTIELLFLSVFDNQNGVFAINGTKVSRGVYEFSGEFTVYLIDPIMMAGTTTTLDAGSLASWKEVLGNNKYIVNP
jgi:hypothetical protein